MLARHCKTSTAQALPCCCNITSDGLPLQQKLTLHFHCSPEEAYQHFISRRITEAQFSQQASQLATSSHLMCRFGNKLYPWQQIAPVVMGTLAFGGDGQQMWPDQGGIAMAVPASEARQMQQEARKVRAINKSKLQMHLVTRQQHGLCCLGLPQRGHAMIYVGCEPRRLACHCMQQLARPAHVTYIYDFTSRPRSLIAT